MPDHPTPLLPSLRAKRSNPAVLSRGKADGLLRFARNDDQNESGPTRETTMARGSTVFRPADVAEDNASGYPEPFRETQRKRYNRRLGNHAGLKNYGVNLIRVMPDGQSSARHAHTRQDEFVYVLEGELVLVTDAGRETVG